MKPKPSVGRPGPEVSGSPRIRPRPIPPGTTWRNRTPDVGRRTSDTSAPTSATEEGTFTLGSSPTFRHPRRVLPSGSVSARTGPLAVPVPGSAGPTSTSVPQCTPSGGPSVPGRIPAPQPVASAVSPGRPRRHLHSIPSADRGDPRTRGSGLGLTVRSSPRVRSGDATDLVPAPPYRSSAVPAPLSSRPLASGAVGGVGGGREEGCRPIDLRSVPFRSAPFSLRSRPTGVSATPPSPESRGSGDRVGRTGPHGRWSAVPSRLPLPLTLEWWGARLQWHGRLVAQRPPRRPLVPSGGVVDTDRTSGWHPSPSPNRWTSLGSAPVPPGVCVAAFVPRSGRSTTIPFPGRSSRRPTRAGLFLMGTSPGPLPVRSGP